MNSKRLYQVLWVIEAVVCALPATVYALLWVMWFIWIGFVYRLDVAKDPVGILGGLFPFIAVALAITVGILGLWTVVTVRPVALLRRPRLVHIAVLSGCVGALVDIPILALFGKVEIRHFEANQLLVDWMLLGPLVVGIHSLYRLRACRPALLVSEGVGKDHSIQ